MFTYSFNKTVNNELHESLKHDLEIKLSSVGREKSSEVLLGSVGYAMPLHYTGMQHLPAEYVQGSSYQSPSSLSLLKAKTS